MIRQCLIRKNDHGFTALKTMHSSPGILSVQMEKRIFRHLWLRRILRQKVELLNPFIPITPLTSAQNSAKRRLLPRPDVLTLRSRILLSSLDESNSRTMRRGRCLRVHIECPKSRSWVKAITYLDLKCQLIARLPV